MIPEFVHLHDADSWLVGLNGLITACVLEASALVSGEVVLLRLVARSRVYMRYQVFRRIQIDLVPTKQSACEARTADFERSRAVWLCALVPQAPTVQLRCLDGSVAGNRSWG